jgi:hypothetical protein
VGDPEKDDKTNLQEPQLPRSLMLDVEEDEDIALRFSQP